MQYFNDDTDSDLKRKKDKTRLSLQGNAFNSEDEVDSYSVHDIQMVLMKELESSIQEKTGHCRSCSPP